MQIVKNLRIKMIKLFSMKNQKKEGGSDAQKPGTGQKRASAAQLRITKGLFTLFLLYLKIDLFINNYNYLLQL